ncbi:hypothetical protein [Arthrobacter sp. SLBN-112]|uniref:hypothetical protein n=1 Tax=Arthrobacter sp. SLBN-112 TaxID=2768452 RepID=UPI0027B7D73C|nr:hypothetical protein [Arthrobacter sp. SLBN-112]MDQ0801365.1 hypothetical protein [Arthrobacter sp. SLBN-112]
MQLENAELLFPTPGLFPGNSESRSLLSLPALGTVNIDRRVRTVVADLGGAIHRHFEPEDDAGEFRPPSLQQSRQINAAVLDDGPIGFR